jgi:hypothetical protein
LRLALCLSGNRGKFSLVRIKEERSLFVSAMTFEDHHHKIKELIRAEACPMLPPEHSIWVGEKLA